MNFDKRLWLAATAAALVVAGAPALAQSVEAGIGAWQAGNYDEAVRAWRPLADRGNADAQFNLGQAYKLGRGVPVNANLAEQWYERAARQGHVQAGANLGLILFQNGQRQRAMPYIQRAAEGGDPRAQYILGTALFNGDLVTRDIPRAYAHMSRAAAAGLPQAAAQLREMEQHLSEEDRRRGVQLAQVMERQAPAAMAAVEPAVTGNVTAQAPAAPPSRPRVANTQVPPSRPGTVGAGPRVNPEFTIRPMPDGPAPRSQPPVADTPRRQAPAVRPTAPTRAPALASAGGRWRVQLGAFSTDANARRAWSAVRGRLPGLQPVFARAGNLIRLQAGPLGSRAAADRTCASVRSAGHACIPVAP